MTDWLLRRKKNKLTKSYSASGGNLKLLRIEIDQDENGIRFCQSKYVEKILKDFQMEEAKTVATLSLGKD
jgi:hypothetical protein